MVRSAFATDTKAISVILGLMTLLLRVLILPEYVYARTSQQ